MPSRRSGATDSPHPHISKAGRQPRRNPDVAVEAHGALDGRHVGEIRQLVALQTCGTHERRSDVGADTRHEVAARGDGEGAERVGQREDEPAVKGLM